MDKEEIRNLSIATVDSILHSLDGALKRASALFGVKIDLHEVMPMFYSAKLSEPVVKTVSTPYTGENRNLLKLDIRIGGSWSNLSGVNFAIWI